MKKTLSILIIWSLTACDSNPLGNTKISSCEHSPNFKTGLPITCQVNFQNIENLKIWLDANDNGTTTSANQTDVESWTDKSGNSTSFSFFNDKARLIKKQVNGRTALRWNSDNTQYLSSALTEFVADQDFTLAFALKTRPSNTGKFKLSNGPGNGFEILVSAEGTVHISLNQEEPFTSALSIADLNVAKFIITYKAQSKELYVYDDNSFVVRYLLMGSSSEWSSLYLSGSEGLELFEMLVYAGKKSDFEIKEIQTYLNNKWGF